MTNITFYQIAVLIVVFVLTAALYFMAGLLLSPKDDTQVIIIEKTMHDKVYFSDSKDVAFVNTYSGVDPTGVTDSKTGLQAALASGKKVIVFDGLYKTNWLVKEPGQIFIYRDGTKFINQ